MAANAFCATVAPKAASVFPPETDRLIRVEGLRKRAEFLAAARGRKAALPGVVVQGVSARRAPPAVGVGFTASKKVGSAVRRNRAKRRLREAARLALAFGARPGWDYVFIARAATLDRSWPSLVADAVTGVLRVSALRR